MIDLKNVFKAKFSPWRIMEPSVLFGLCLLIIIIFSQKISFSVSDLGRHLENGRLVFQNSQLLYNNFYSYTEPEYPFVNHHWLSGIFFYITYRLGGFTLLSLLNIVLALSIFLVFFKLARRRANFFIVAFLAIPAIFLLSERTEVRPEMFSYLFFGLTWLVLESKQLSRRKKMILLIPLFIVWVNIHIYFFLGLALIFFYLMTDLLNSVKVSSFNNWSYWRQAFKDNKEKIIDFFVIIAACLFNPNHIRGLLYPLRIFQNYGYQVAENKSIFFLNDLMLNHNFRIYGFLLFLMLISLVSHYLLTSKRRKQDWFLGIFLALMALLAIRNLAIFGLVALVVSTSGLQAAWFIIENTIKPFLIGRERIIKIGAYSALLLTIILSGIFLLTDINNRQSFLKNSPGLGLSAGSLDAFIFYKEKNLRGPVFNNYDVGSALIFGLSNEEPVFVDNRPEAYSVDFFTNVYKPMQENLVDWQKNLSEQGFNTIFFAHTDSTPWAKTFLLKIVEDEAWALVYFDRYYLILVRRSAYDSNFIATSELNDWSVRQELRLLATFSSLKEKFNLADLAQLLGQPNLAEEIYRQVMLDKPLNYRAIFARAYLYSSFNDKDSWLTAISYLNQGLAKEPRMPGAYNQMGLLYWRLGNQEKAEESWRKALKINRSDKQAKDYLKQLEALRLSGRIIY